MSLDDVKGYYRTLGVASGASAAEVKRAFRARAKEAHPDAGGAGDGAVFGALSEAYHVLGDSRRRADYDSLCRSLARAAPPGPAAAPPEHAPEPVRCRGCGTVSAQPRYVRLRQATGLLTRSRITVVEGVWCRACADRAALLASLHTWLLGWWSLPRGPLDAARALLVNLAGGEKPAERNAALLARQARAFAARGEAELAAGLALQANDFRADPALGPLIAAGGARRLRDRWRVGGAAFVVQALPFALAVASLAVWVGRRVLSLGGG